MDKREALIRAAKIYHVTEGTWAGTRFNDEVRSRQQGAIGIFENLGFEIIDSGAHRVVFGNEKIVVKVAKDERSCEENKKALAHYKKMVEVEDLRENIAEIEAADTESYIWIVQEQVSNEKPKKQVIERLRMKFKKHGIKDVDIGNTGKRRDGTPVLYDLAPASGRSFEELY